MMVRRRFMIRQPGRRALFCAFVGNVSAYGDGAPSAKLCSYTHNDAEYGWLSYPPIGAEIEPRSNFGFSPGAGPGTIDIALQARGVAGYEQLNRGL
jgi:hypothetical protein